MIEAALEKSGLSPENPGHRPDDGAGTAQALADFMTFVSQA